MSNAAYRMQMWQIAQVRKQRLEEATQLLEQAKEASPREAARVDELVHECYLEAGGQGLDLEIEACSKMMQAGNLCRENEMFYMRVNQERLKQNLEQEKFPKQCVSASVHLQAVRGHRRAIEKRIELNEEARLQAAGELEHAETRERAQADRESWPEPKPQAATAEAAANEPEAKAAPPGVAATSRVA